MVGKRNAEARDVICDRTFVFKSQGWQNVHVAGSAWIIVDSLMIILLAVPVDDDDRLLAESIWPTACCFSFLVKAKLVEYYRSINSWAWKARLWIVWFIKVQK